MNFYTHVWKKEPANLKQLQINDKNYKFLAALAKKQSPQYQNLQACFTFQVFFSLIF